MAISFYFWCGESGVRTSGKIESKKGYICITFWKLCLSIKRYGEKQKTDQCDQSLFVNVEIFHTQRFL